MPGPAKREKGPAQPRHPRTAEPAPGETPVGADSSTPDGAPNNAHSSVRRFDRLDGPIHEFRVGVAGAAEVVNRRRQHVGPPLGRNDAEIFKNGYRVFVMMGVEPFAETGAAAPSCYTLPAAGCFLASANALAAAVGVSGPISSSTSAAALRVVVGNRFLREVR